MAPRTESPVALKAAFSPTFDDRNNVVRLPEMAGASPRANFSWHGIEATTSTNSLVPLGHAMPNIAGIGPDSPLMDTFLRAERGTSFGDRAAAAPTYHRPGFHSWRTPAFVDLGPIGAQRAIS